MAYLDLSVKTWLFHHTHRAFKYAQLHLLSPRCALPYGLDRFLRCQVWTPPPPCFPSGGGTGARLAACATHDHVLPSGGRPWCPSSSCRQTQTSCTAISYVTLIPILQTGDRAGHSQFHPLQKHSRDWLQKKKKTSHLKACTELLQCTGWDTDTAWEHIQNSLLHLRCCSQRFSNVSQQSSCWGLSVTVTLKLNPAAKHSVGTADRKMRVQLNVRCGGGKCESSHQKAVTCFKDAFI